VIRNLPTVTHISFHGSFWKCARSFSDTVAEFLFWRGIRKLYFFTHLKVSASRGTDYSLTRIIRLLIHHAWTLRFSHTRFWLAGPFEAFGRFDFHNSGSWNENVKSVDFIPMNAAARRAGTGFLLEQILNVFYI